MHGFYMELQAATSRNRFDCGEVGGFQQLQAAIRGRARLRRLGPGKSSYRTSPLGPIPLVRLPLPAQQVDATLSNSLILQHFPERTDLSGCIRSKLSQGSVLFDSTLVSAFSL